MLEMVGGSGIIGQDMVCPLSPPYISAAGESPLVLQSKAAPIKGFTLSGESRQVTTTGAQLLNKHIALVSNGVSVVLDGSTVSFQGIIQNLDPANRVHVYVPITLDIGTYSITINNPKIVTSIRGNRADGTPFYLDGESFEIQGGEQNLKLFLLLKNSQNLSPGTPVPLTTAHIMLNTGTTSLPWEPYTGGIPSPNPDYSQEIESIGDGGKLDLNVVTGGKNLAKKTSQAPSISTNEKMYWISERRIQEGKYTVSFSIKADTPDVKVRVYTNDNSPVSENPSICFTSRDVGIAVGTEWTRYELNGNLLQTFIPDSSYALFFYTGKDVDKKVSVKDVKLEFGNVSTKWSPAPEDITPENAEQYKSLIQNVTISLTEPLRGIGDVRDKITLKDGTWGVERWIGKLVSDGSNDEKWYRDGTILSGKNRYFMTIDNANLSSLDNNTSLCNVLSLLPAGQTYAAKTGYTITNNSRVYVYINGRTLEEFKVWLSNNPITLIYSYTTPVWEPFSPEIQLDKMSTYTGCTTITNNEGAHMSLRYKKGK